MVLPTKIRQSVMEKSHYPFRICFIPELVKPDIHDLIPTVEERYFTADFPFKPSYPTKKKIPLDSSSSADAPASSSRINPDL